MHYVAYLDDFGHIGPYVSRDHEKYNDSPVFGLAGILIPAPAVRDFAVFFYKIKCRFLSFELASEDHNPRKLKPYQWEKKGAQLYTVPNVTKYRRTVVRMTNLILKEIRRIDGHVFYVGEHKTIIPSAHDSAETFKGQLLRAVRKLNDFCHEIDSTFLLLLDEQKAGDTWRERNVEACTLAMFDDAKKCRALVEPPLQGESHLFQTLQCADWICGLFGRLNAYLVAPQEYPDWQIFEKLFAAELRDLTLTSSDLTPQKDASTPVELAVGELPDSPGPLAGHVRTDSIV